MRLSKKHMKAVHIPLLFGSDAFLLPVIGAGDNVTVVAEEEHTRVHPPEDGRAPRESEPLKM